MNKENIIKLLASENEDDNLLALNILRGRNRDNWGGFLIELENICHGYFYTQRRKSIYWRFKTGYEYIETQLHLWDKYFRGDFRRELRQEWYNQID